jgi:hypothetical protein
VLFVGGRRGSDNDLATAIFSDASANGRDNAAATVFVATASADASFYGSDHNRGASLRNAYCVCHCIVSP